MLGTGKMFRNALLTVFVGGLVVYMINSYINYQARYGSSTISVLPKGTKIAIWIFVGFLLLATIIPRRKFH